MRTKFGWVHFTRLPVIYFPKGEKVPNVLFLSSWYQACQNDLIWLHLSYGNTQIVVKTIQSSWNTGRDMSPLSICKPMPVLSWYVWQQNILLEIHDHSYHSISLWEVNVFKGKKFLILKLENIEGEIFFFSQLPVTLKSSQRVKDVNIFHMCIFFHTLIDKLNINLLHY